MRTYAPLRRVATSRVMPRSTLSIFSLTFAVVAFAACEGGLFGENNEDANGEDPAASQQGLTFSAYEGDFQTLPDFTTLTPTDEGVVDTFDISSRADADLFAMVFKGVVMIDEE